LDKVVLSIQERHRVDLRRLREVRDDAPRSLCEYMDAEKSVE
jgi:hypothetical protein